MLGSTAEAGVIRVRYFAAARELAGCPEEWVPLLRPEMAASAVLALLGERHVALGPHVSRMRLAVNGTLVLQDATVREGDEVDVLPPVAGGSGEAVQLCELREAPLSVDECIGAVTRPGAGGVAVFVGIVRDHADGQPVARLDYEAHPELALAEMRRVLAEVAASVPEVRLAATHRVGRLGVGDLAVVVAASAAHRAQAFEACEQAIEGIKARVPIWKKEWGPDGSAHWVNL